MILGRDAEFAKLEDLLASLRSGEGLFLAVTGEPGIGKTTLLDWTEAAATGVRVLRATGRESEANLPFVALADLLSRCTIGPLHCRRAGSGPGLRSGLRYRRSPEIVWRSTRAAATLVADAAENGRPYSSRRLPVD